MSWHRGVLILVAGAALAACDGGPSGPGTLSATVSGPTPLGAVLLEVTGPGVRGFVGQGDTRVYGAELSAAEGKHRVVAVSAGGGTLRVGIQVDDLGALPPQVVVLTSASPENLTVLNTGVTAVIAQPR